MAIPARTGTIAQSNNGSGSLTVSLAGIADGSWMVLQVQSGATAITVTTPSGWTPLFVNQAMGSRGISLFGKIKTSGDTNVVLAKSGSANFAVLLAHGTGGDIVSNWILGTGKLRATAPAETVTTTAKSLNTVSADNLVLAFSYEATSAAEGSAPVTSGAGWTAWGYRADGASDGVTGVIEQLRVAYLEKAVAGATGDETDTYANSQANNGYGIQLAIPPSTPAQVGPAGILVTSGGAVQPGNAVYFDGSDKLLLDPNTHYTRFLETRVSDIFRYTRLWFGLHRGGSYNHPEETLYGYQGCADLGARVMEVSVQYSSDGTPWCFHDATVDRTASAGETGAVSSKNDATLSGILNKGGTAAGNPGQPARPAAKFVDVLDAWSDTHVLIVEDKTYTHTSAFLDLLDSYDTVDRPATERFVIKMDASSSDTVRAAAAARGYQTWGYIFDANMGTPFTTALTRPYSMLGLDFNSSDSTLSAAIISCIAHEIRPTGHIIATQAQRDRLLDLGMTGLMISNKFILPTYLPL